MRTCDLLCAKALLSGFHTFRASMCWLALVAEMLLLEVGHSKERRVSVDVKAGLLQLLRVVLQRSEVRVSLNTSTCPGVPCKASIKPASACRELPCASRGPLGISGGEKTGSSPTASDRGCLNNSFGIRSQGWCVYTRWCRAFSQAKQHDQTCSGCRAQGWQSLRINPQNGIFDNLRQAISRHLR